VSEHVHDWETHLDGTGLCLGCGKFRYPTSILPANESELARLRAIEAAAREVVKYHHVPVNGGPLGHRTSPYIEDLRNALKDK